MIRTLFWGVALIIILGLFAAYSGSINFHRDVSTAPARNTGIANPASVHCTEIGGTLEIATESSGGQAGYCHLKDGSVCEEWTLFQTGECTTPVR